MRGNIVFMNNALSFHIMQASSSQEKKMKEKNLRDYTKASSHSNVAVLCLVFALRITK